MESKSSIIILADFDFSALPKKFTRAFMFSIIVDFPFSKAFWTAPFDSRIPMHSSTAGESIPSEPAFLKSSYIFSLSCGFSEM